jgi:hypothetical protein
MASNNDFVIAVYDVNGDPLPGVTPTWVFLKDVGTGSDVTPPDVTHISNGVYKAARAALLEQHIAGLIDFGASAKPRYVLYEDPRVDARPPYVSFIGGGATSNPVVAQVDVPRRNQVRVTFSEPVVMTGDVNGALRLANYDIPGLTLYAVSRVSDTQVLLTTAVQVPGTAYNLTISNVEDLDGNPVAPL